MPPWSNTWRAITTVMSTIIIVVFSLLTLLAWKRDVTRAHFHVHPLKLSNMVCNYGCKKSMEGGLDEPVSMLFVRMWER